MNKKGLSDIITTVLIILLAIAAVVLIWAFIKRPIQQGGQQIQSSTDCLSLELKPTACVLNNNTNTASITVQWVQGSVKLIGAQLIITDVNGLNNVTNISAPSSILATSTGQINYNSLNQSGPLVASAVGQIEESDGSTVMCTSSTQDTIACS